MASLTLRQWQLDRDPGPLSGARFNARLAAQESGALLQAHQTEVSLSRACPQDSSSVETAAVVCHLHAQAPARSCHLDQDLAGGGVARDVGQRLLDDAVHRHSLVVEQPPGKRFLAQGNLQAGLMPVTLNVPFEGG